MARSTPAGESFGKWLNGHLARRGWRQIDLINASGGQLVPQTVSKWVKSQYAPDPNTVVTVAATLGEPLGDALRAAGYGAVADAMGEPPVRLVGAEPEPLDEGIRRVLARKDLTPERQAGIIKSYQRRAELLLEDLDEMIAAATELRNEPNGESQTA